MSFVPTMFAPWRPSILWNALEDKTDGSTIDVISITTRTAIVSVATILLSVKFHEEAGDAIFLSLAVIPVVFVVELFRVSEAVHQKALDLLQSNTVTTPLLEYLCTSPQAIEELSKDQEKFSKFCTAHGLSLFQLILDGKHRHGLQVLNWLLRSPILQTRDVLILLVRHENPQFAIQALEQGFFNLDEEAQLAVWREVTDVRIVRALVQSGWDINIKNRKGDTPLKNMLLAVMRYYHHKQESMVYHLMSVGAKFPGLDDTFKKYDYDRPTTFYDGLKDYPKILAACKQKGPPFTPFQDQKNSLLATISYYEKKIEVHSGSILLRTTAIALAVLMACVPITLYYPHDSKPIGVQIAWVLHPYVIAPLAAWIFNHYAWKHASKILDDQALLDCTRTFPPHEVIKHILQSPALVERLLKTDYNLSKLDDCGKTIWETLLNSENTRYYYVPLNGLQCAIAGKLIYALFSEKYNDQKINLIIEVLISGHTNALEYLLKYKKISKDDNCFDLWTHIYRGSIAKILTNHGFDIEVTNQSGVTPLVYLVRHYGSVDQIKALLEAGAAFDDTLLEGHLPENVKPLLLSYKSKPNYKSGSK